MTAVVERLAGGSYLDVRWADGSRTKCVGAHEFKADQETLTGEGEHG